MYSPFGPRVMFREPREGSLEDLINGKLYVPAPTGYGIHELKVWGKAAIWAVRRAIHHGSANMDGRQAEYRCRLLDKLGDEFERSFPGGFKQPYGDYLEMLFSYACAGLTAKSGRCGEMASLTFLWLLKNVRQCRVVFVECSKVSATMGIDDHAFVLLISGKTALAVDAWVKRPFLCFASELSSFYNIALVKNFFVADVQLPETAQIARIIRFMITEDVDARDMRRELYSHEERRRLKAKGAGVGNLDIYTNVDTDAGMQYGVWVGAHWDPVPLPPPPPPRAGILADEFTK